MTALTTKLDGLIIVLENSSSIKIVRLVECVGIAFISWNDGKILQWYLPDDFKTTSEGLTAFDDDLMEGPHSYEAIDPKNWFFWALLALKLVK